VIAAVIVPALKLPEPSLYTIDETVFADAKAMSLGVAEDPLMLPLTVPAEVEVLAMVARFALVIAADPERLEFVSKDHEGLALDPPETRTLEVEASGARTDIALVALETTTPWLLAE
jgi:hypothetical protein